MLPDWLRRCQNPMAKNKHLWTYVIFCFMAIVCFYKAFKFQYANFIFSYPFISYDGYQWMADGLHYLDRTIDATHRNPALPLTFSFLRSWGLVDSFPFFVSTITFSFYLSTYFLVRTFASPPVTRLTVLWFFFVFRIHNFFDFVLSDPWCLTLTTAGLGFLLRTRREPKNLVGAAVSFGLAMNYQFVPAFMAPALIWYVCRELGWHKIKEQPAIFIWSTVIFLMLALPQFIYKWMAFGSPLYSHVIHFPLMRVHLFGLPYYAVNMFAFLGWPLALVMLYGVRCTFYSKENSWQLIHLYALCMTLFWIVSYLWLDVRFLLYLVPAWVAYTARGIEELNLLNWLNFRNKTPIHRAAILVSIYFATSLSSFKANAFESNLLPLTPQMSLRFSTRPISEWGVSTLTTDHITSEHSDTYETLFNISGHFKFYRRFARAQRAYSNEFIDDVINAAKFLESDSTTADRIGLCGDLANVYETKMRIFFTINRNTAECANAHRSIVTKSDFQKMNAGKTKHTQVWQGKELVIFKE